MTIPLTIVIEDTALGPKLATPFALLRFPALLQICCPPTVIAPVPSTLNSTAGVPSISEIHSINLKSLWD